MNKRQKKKRAKQNEIKKAIDQIVIDCAAFDTKAKIHEAFHNEPLFPDYTGNNLDAMFDMLTEIAKPLAIEVKNLSTWEAAPESFRGNVRKLLERAGRENPNLTVTID